MGAAGWPPALLPGHIFAMAAACGASPTLRSVCRQLVPAWADLRDDDIDVDPLLGGLSNKLWHVRLPAPGGRHPTEIVLRQFCTTSGLIDRPYEQRVFAFLADTGFAPKLFGANGEFRAEQYIRGVSLTVEVRRLRILIALCTRY